MHKILVVIGTHPEAIRAAPLIQRLQAIPSMRTVVCVATQHCELLAHELANFGIETEEVLGSVEQGANLNLSEGVDKVIAKHKPDCVLVYGDADMSMASFRGHTSFGNLGGELRMYELHHRTPEGESLHMIDLTATRYFVSSERSRDNMLKDGVASENLFVTDSTEVDAILMVVKNIRNDAKLNAKLAGDFRYLDPNKRLIYVAGHLVGDESRLRSLCCDLKHLALRADVQLVFPKPADCSVGRIVDECFAGLPNIALIPPPDYLHSVYLMQAAFLILADLGHIHKGALSLNKPVLVMADVSETHEAVEAGSIKFVGADAAQILRECTRFLEDPSYYQAFSSHRNPYGDGHASQRIVETLLR